MRGNKVRWWNFVAVVLPCWGADRSLSLMPIQYMTTLGIQYLLLHWPKKKEKKALSFLLYYHFPGK